MARHSRSRWRNVILNLPVKKRRAKTDLAVGGGRGKLNASLRLNWRMASRTAWAFMDLTRSRASGLFCRRTGLVPRAGKLIEQSNEIKDAKNLYHEALRPQFHFFGAARVEQRPEWLVFYRGEYHQFFQHNPYGWDWGNMHWGHAVSRDLLHWREQPEALYPGRNGDDVQRLGR